MLCPMAHANTNSTDSDPFFDSTASLLASRSNAADDVNSLVSWQRDALQSDPFAALARDVRRPIEGDADWTDASVYAPSPADGGTGSFDLSAVLPPVAPTQPMRPLTVSRPPLTMPSAPRPLLSQQIASGRPIPSAVALPSMLAPDFSFSSSPLAAQQSLVVTPLPTPFALCGGSADPIITSAPRAARRRARTLDPLVAAYHQGVKRERRNAAANRLAMYLVLVGMAAAMYAGYVAFVR
jgi:hypothetical protein